MVLEVSVLGDLGLQQIHYNGENRAEAAPVTWWSGPKEWDRKRLVPPNPFQRHAINDLITFIGPISSIIWQPRLWDMDLRERHLIKLKYVLRKETEMQSWFTATLSVEVHVENHFKHFDLSVRTEGNQAGENLPLVVGLGVTQKTHRETVLWPFDQWVCIFCNSSLFQSSIWVRVSQRIYNTGCIRWSCIIRGRIVPEYPSVESSESQWLLRPSCWMPEKKRDQWWHPIQGLRPGRHLDHSWWKSVFKVSKTRVFMWVFMECCWERAALQTFKWSSRVHSSWLLVPASPTSAMLLTFRLGLLHLVSFLICQCLWKHFHRQRQTCALPRLAEGQD